MNISHKELSDKIRPYWPEMVNSFDRLQRKIPCPLYNKSRDLLIKYMQKHEIETGKD